MTEPTMNNFAEAEGYLRDLDSLNPPEAYIAVVAAQAHATLAQATAAAQMVELQKVLLASMLPSPTPQEQVKAAMEEAEALARAMPGPEEQEPKEFGSIVRAGYDEHSDRVLWVRASGGWYSEVKQGFHAFFAGLHDPEVLRVGLGGDPGAKAIKDAQAEAFRAGERVGAAGMNRKVHFQLTLLLEQAITSERKNALEKAIQAVEELAP